MILANLKPLLPLLFVAAVPVLGIPLPASADETMNGLPGSGSGVFTAQTSGEQEPKFESVIEILDDEDLPPELRSSTSSAANDSADAGGVDDDAERHDNRGPRAGYAHRPGRR